MRFFGICLWLGIKEFLIRPTFWAVLLVLPAILAIAAFLFQSEESIITVTAGVYFDSEDPFERAIFEALDSASMVNFVAYDDADELLNDVMLGRIESGYIFNDNIHNAKTGDFSGIITLSVSSRTIASAVLNDIVAAAVLQTAAPYITNEALQSFFPENAYIDAFVAQDFARYALSDIFMTPTFISGDGEVADAPPTIIQATAARIMRGIIGLGIHILMLFTLPIFAKEGMGHLSRALRFHKKLWVYNLSLWLSPFIMMFVVGAAGLFAAAMLAPSFVAEAGVEIAALAVLCAVCASILVIVGRLLKSARSVQAFGLFIIIANIVFGGVVLDLSELSPSLAHMQRVFPLFWYTSF